MGEPKDPTTIKLPGNTSSYDPAVYRAVGGTIADLEKRPAFFGPKEWAAIARYNNLLTAMSAIYDKDGKTIIGIEPAPTPGKLHFFLVQLDFRFSTNCSKLSGSKNAPFLNHSLSQ